LDAIVSIEKHVSQMTNIPNVLTFWTMT